jgi:hypothetical protein
MDWAALGLIAAGYGASLALYGQLPNMLLSEQQGPWFTRPVVAFFLPTAAVLLLAVFGRLSRPGRDPDHVSVDDDTRGEIVFHLVFFLVALHALVIGGLSGVLAVRSWAYRAPMVLFGVLLMAVGNILPRLRLPADCERTLRYRRSAGHAAVYLGAFFVIAAAVLPGLLVAPVLGAGAIVATVVSSVRLYRDFHAHSRPE